MFKDEVSIGCNFCNKTNAIYYCNKCNMVFCSACKKEEVKNLIICASCGTIIAEIHNGDLENEIKYNCPKCKSDKYVTGQKRLKYCPGCNQTDISTIAEKKRNLIETSRKLIYEFRYSYRELYSFLKKLERAKTKLINLRKCGFFHDPKIESIIIKLLRSIPTKKDQITFRIEQDQRILKVPLQKFLDPTKWTPDKFFLLEASLNQIKEIMNNFRNFIDEIIGNSNTDLNKINEKINAISYYKNIYDEFENLLDILPGELPICAFKKLKFKKSSFKDISSRKGVLFFTDRRMIFLQKVGLMFKKYEQIFDFFLEGFEKAEMVGKIFKKLKFTLEEGYLTFSASEKVIQAIINYFNISINFEKYRAEDEIPSEILDPIDLDLLDLKQKVELIITALLSLNQSNYIINQIEQFSPPNLGFQSDINRINECKEFPTLNIERLLLKIQGEEFSLQNTLRNLEEKFNQRIITSEEYIKQFRHLQTELFSTRKSIEEIQTRIKNNSCEKHEMDYETLKILDIK